MTHLNQAVTKAINYLHAHQLPNGEFCTYMSGDDAMQGWVLPMGMIFPTAVICHSLQFITQEPKVEEMLTKSAGFLRYQIGRGATWNHFTNFNRLRKICPQDMDDTVCVSSFLVTRYADFNPAVNRRLICDNRAANGLFYTWFTFRWRFNRNLVYWRLSLAQWKNPFKTIFLGNTESSINDIDAVVNANVLYYLDDVPETQAVIKHLLRIIEQNRESDCDTWYRNIFSVYYFFSRNYYKGITKLEPLRQPIIDRIAANAQPGGRIGEAALDTALAACTLMNLGYQGPVLEKAIEFLISTQHEAGNWERRLLYYGGPKKLAGYGGEELTTGLCLEALARYAKQLQSRK